MYNDYFHFSELPFSIAPNPHFMFMSTRHQEGLAHLLYGINHAGGFVALTGEVGTGKTTLCHCLLQQLPIDVEIALILNPKLNSIELLATLCDELDIDYNRQNYSLKNLLDALNLYLLTAHAKGCQTVLLIDEAQNLSMEVLEQVRLLTNLETSKTKLLQIILVGQPELNDLLMRTELRQLNQRITARYHLQPLTKNETREYIRHRLKVCGGNPDLFNDSAINKIFRFSKGIPRVINILSHSALLGVYVTEAKTVTGKIVKRAAKESLGLDCSKPSYVKPLLVIFIILSVLAAYVNINFISEIFQKIHVRAIDNTILAIKPKEIPKDVTVNKQPQPTKSKSFIELLSNPENSLGFGLNKILIKWGKQEALDSTTISCNDIQKLGLECQFDKGSWKEILAFNRPVIMEFSLNDDSKRYAVLDGIEQNQPVFKFQKASAFPLTEVFNYWNGYYLLLWKLPVPDMIPLAQGQTSNNVKWLRESLRRFDKVDTKKQNSNFFDNDLKARVIAFQKAHRIVADGIVGLKTIFYLDSESGAQDSPHLQD